MRPSVEVQAEALQYLVDRGKLTNREYDEAIEAGEAAVRAKAREAELQEKTGKDRLERYLDAVRNADALAWLPPAMCRKTAGSRMKGKNEITLTMTVGAAERLIDALLTAEATIYRKAPATEQNEEAREYLWRAHSQIDGALKEWRKRHG